MGMDGKDQQAVALCEGNQKKFPKENPAFQVIRWLRHHRYVDNMIICHLDTIIVNISTIQFDEVTSLEDDFPLDSSGPCRPVETFSVFKLIVLVFINSHCLMFLWKLVETFCKQLLEVFHS